LGFRIPMISLMSIAIAFAISINIAKGITMKTMIVRNVNGAIKKNINAIISNNRVSIRLSLTIPRKTNYRVCFP